MKLIQHLPPRLREIKELYDIQEAIEPELKRLTERCRQIILNRNPWYADLEGVMVWEEWLKIIPDPDKSLEQRKLDIIAKLNERLPFTLTQLYRILCGIVGSEYLDIKTYPGRAYIEILIDVSQRDCGNSIGYLLKRIVPVHVAYDVVYQYVAEPDVVKVYSGYEDAYIIEIPVEKEIADVYLNSPNVLTEIIEVKNE